MSIISQTGVCVGEWKPIAQISSLLSHLRHGSPGQKKKSGGKGIIFGNHDE